MPPVSEKRSRERKAILLDRVQLWAQWVRLHGMLISQAEHVSYTNLFAPHWVDPSRILYKFEIGALGQEFVSNLAVLDKNKRFHPAFSAGIVSPGDWPQRVVSYDLESSVLYHSLRERVNKGVDWEKTEWWNVCRKRIMEGYSVWNGATNYKELTRRCDRADALICSVKKRGFVYEGMPVCVAIGRNGELIKSGNGQHRIMLGKILCLKIPVRVLVVHEEWFNSLGVSGSLC